ncbi:hypothetical protein [Nocardia sp. NPDC005745]|uniref:hypothetical protein n=1 Tax=Nocardia sp. NPDC005745 TaxID=3157061 RepID=UPI0033D96900
MGSYTVVITPHHAEAGATNISAPQLTIEVEDSRPEPRVTGIAISTEGSTGLTPQALTDIDIVAIVKALASRFVPHVENLEPARLAAAPVQSKSSAVGSAPALAGQARDPVAIAPSDGSMTLFDGNGAASGRAYRRMPDADELRSQYQQLGTVTALARHYGVPRHTAQGWMGRLRKLDQPGHAGSVSSSDQTSTPRTDAQE